VKEGTKESRLAADSTGVIAGRTGEELDVGRCQIGQRVAFEVAPKGLDRIQFRGIGREESQVQFTAALEQSVDVFAAVRPKAIPNDEQGLLKMGCQNLEEAHNLRTGNVGVGVEGKVKSQARSDGGQGQSGDHRNFLIRAGLLIKDGGLPARGPGAPEQGSHQKAAFVNENQVGVQLAGFFLRRGHSALIHRRMARSSRSRARLSGLWGLQPMERSRRPMWST